MAKFKVGMLAALSTMALYAAPANAATTFSGLGSETVVDGNGTFSDALIPKTVAGSTFTDTITFSVSSAGSLTAIVAYSLVTKGLSSLSATLNGQAISLGSIGGTSYAGSTTVDVAAGVQTLVLSGVSTGNKSSYAGTVQFSAVPEPAAWALMIVGFGFAGASLRRRRNDVSTTKFAIA